MSKRDELNQRLTKLATKILHKKVNVYVVPYIPSPNGQRVKGKATVDEILINEKDIFDANVFLHECAHLLLGNVNASSNDSDTIPVGWVDERKTEVETNRLLQTYKDIYDEIINLLYFR